ncbi:hypothetical protein [Actinomadura sp. WMMA1423]|uniref:hypothetical protein n=1 Tax=Actinomadura sp. WMMA1423 TaxID=2591108 RepID=UPI0011472A56|nr:hypothetical protein [Actinomadura sp. WMMA1423]
METVRPAHAGGHGASWEALEAEHARVQEWVRKDRLSVTKIAVLLERRGVVVPYRTLHRFCVERCGFGRTAATVRVADGEPGAELQIDFAQIGPLRNPGMGRRRGAAPLAKEELRGLRDRPHRHARTLPSAAIARPDSQSTPPHAAAAPMEAPPATPDSPRSTPPAARHSTSPESGAASPP